MIKLRAIISTFHAAVQPRRLCVASKLYAKFQATLLIFLGALLTFSPVAAISDAQLDMFDQNGIYYYDPSGSALDNCYTGNGLVTILGTTAEEMMWSGLMSLGFTEAQTAAIMGNIASEGIGNPAQHEGALYYEYWDTNRPDATYVDGHFNLGANAGISYGLGIVQWSGSRRVTLYNMIQEKDPALLQYFNNPTTYSMDSSGNIYGLNGNGFIEVAGIDAMKAMLSHQLTMIWDEMHSSHIGIDDYANDVYGGAWWVLAKYEIPAGDLSYGAAKHELRYSRAQAYYDQFAGGYDYSSGGGTVSSDSVTIIGDSITNGSRNDILELLPDASIHAQDSKFFDDDVSGNESGLTVLSSLGDSLGDTVVFALGTNDVIVDQATIQQVVDAVGPSRTVVFVTAYDGNPDTSARRDYSSFNANLQAVASTNSNVVVADWASAAGVDPNTYINMSDGYYVHAAPGAGTQLFAQTIYDAVNRNSGNNVCNDTGTFSQYVLSYAWPDYHSSPYIERMPAYAEVVAKRQSEGLYVGGSVRGVAGIDCGGWVTTLVNESGWDPNYNHGGVIANGASNTGPQEAWAKENWTYLNPNGVIDPSILQPGDVAFTDGHTWIYVGEISGFNSNIASASYSRDGTGGRAPMAGTEGLDISYSSTLDAQQTVRWYRK